MRRVVAALVAVAAAVLVAPAPAAAHGGAVITIHGDGRGTVWISAQFADGHPIVSGAAASLLATSESGGRVGPVALRPVGDGKGTMSLDGQLKAGVWRVVAEMGAPAIGRCETTMTVAAPELPASPTDTRCGDVSQPSTAPAAARPIDRADRSRWWFIAAVVLVPLAAVAVVVVRNRRRPASTTRAAGARARLAAARAATSKASRRR